MKTKNCYLCNILTSHAYRIKITPGKKWVFVCGKCCIKSKKGEFYIYGGTWKGKKR